MTTTEESGFIKKLIQIESPYGSLIPSIVETNVQYARRCLRDSLKRGEAPFASHLLYTQPGVLNVTVIFMNVHLASKQDCSLHAKLTHQPSTSILGSALG